jgi:UDP-glucose 4-epimerase
MNRGSDEDILKTNVLGTRGLLQGMAQYAPNAALVFSSSFQVYDPKSLYGLSKVFAEKLIERESIVRGLSATVLRFSNLFGPGAKPWYNSVVATFAEQMSTRQKITVHGDGSSRRDFLYIADAVSAIEAGVRLNQDRFQNFDICSGRLVSTKELLKYMQKFAQFHVDVIYQDDQRIGQWKMRKRTFEKVKEALGWEPKTKLESGLEEVMKSK